MSQIQPDFWQLSTLIANISGNDRNIENRKSTWSTTFHPLLGEKIGELWSTNQKVIDAHVDLHNWAFYLETIFRPLGGAGPSNLYRPYNPLKCMSSRTWGAGRPHVGLCPIFLVRVCYHILTTHYSCLKCVIWNPWYAFVCTRLQDVFITTCREAGLCPSFSAAAFTVTADLLIPSLPETQSTEPGNLAWFNHQISNSHKWWAYLMKD